MTSATDTPALPSPEARPIIAAAWMMGAVASFTSMAVAGRIVSLELDTFEILGWRSLMGVIVMALAITFGGMWKTIDFHRFDLHLSRNIFHFAAQNLWFYAIFTIPLAQVFALEFTAPLWALLLSRLFLGEKLSTSRIVAALLGFLGILLVTRPGSVPITPGLISAAACAVGFAMTYVFTKKLTAVAHTASILFWMTVLQTVFGFACAGIDGDIALPSLAAAPWVVVIGVTGLTAHFCITCALRVAPATLVMPFDFLRLPVIAVVGLILFDEPISLFLIAGAALILCGNYLNIRSAAGRSA